jgi:hypothetical protein
MQEGYQLDHTAGGRLLAGEWVEGEPKPSFWFGGVSIADRERREIRVYRCQSCGFLESYAK